MFGATRILKYSDKENCVYSGYGITFDSVGSWIFANDTARNVIIFGVNNSSSSHANNCKINFLVLDEGPIFGINGRFGSLEKKICVNFSKANTKFWLSSHYNADNSYISLILNTEIKVLTFKLNFDSEI